jgi:hypothetical protein
MVESIHISPAGNQAHVLFCDHEASKAFYDKYPNGIDIDKEKRKTVFVEMGKEVDVISSQLSFNLSIGSTRVVRAVGVSMNINMGELLKLAGANNRKVEKIVDCCVPGEVSWQPSPRVACVLMMSLATQCCLPFLQYR